MEKLDYKKEYKDLYLPKAKPMLIKVPSMKFIMVKGKGDPNCGTGEYQDALSLLYVTSSQAQSNTSCVTNSGCLIKDIHSNFSLSL